MKRPARSAALLAALGLSLVGPLRADDDALAIVQRAFEAAKANEAAARSYVYHERIEQRRFDKRGEEKKRESWTWDVTQLDHSEHRRLIAKDDRPLYPETAAKEQRKLEKQIRKMQRETPRQRAKRIEKVEKSREEGEEFLEEITRAFDFRLVGEEEIEGVATHVITAEPKPGYVPHGREARVLPKVRARLWVAQDDYGWVQVEMETLDNITWAAVFKLKKGAEMRFRQRRLDDGVWIGERWKVRMGARIALVYRLAAEITGSYSNFRKFTTETTITDWTPVEG